MSGVMMYMVMIFQLYRSGDSNEVVSILWSIVKFVLQG